MTSPYLERPLRSLKDALEDRRAQAYRSCVLEALAFLAVQHPQLRREVRQIPEEITRRCCVQGYTEGLLPDQVAVLTLHKWRSLKVADAKLEGRI